MKVVLISDTHNAHEGLGIPPCDLLVHGGDWSKHGTRDETLAFFRWFGAQPARARLLTAGNHDVYAEAEPETVRELARTHGAHYLVDEGATILGLRVWASPFTPRHGQWAFQAERGAASLARWTAIPERLDLLLTHGPPHGVLDQTSRGPVVGCEALLELVRARAPRVHVFGHIHEQHGETRIAGSPTLFVNASSFMSTRVRSTASTDVHPPRVLTLEPMPG